MKERKNTIRKITVGLAALVMALSMAGCSSTETGDAASEKEKTTTTTAAAETEAPEEEKAESETEEETTTTTTAPAESEAETTSADKKSEPAVTSLPDDFDAQIESMIASAEAEIPDITAFSGFDIDTSKSGGKTTTEAEKTTAKTENTAKTEEFETPILPVETVDNEQQFVFEGKTYDNATFTSPGVPIPAGWSQSSTSSGNQYENSAYPECYLVEGNSKGALYIIANAKSSGKTSFPSLQLYKGLTWGATADDIKAAYGEPAKESHSEQFGTDLTNLFYNSADNALIVYEVSSDWGLIAVNCFGK
ncbi:hypothetical protein [Ruminococcus sp.]|uniref:hypothetical protein n=1 Tax=Ruminococcus sp. TaxID=41978 RepID=UPI0025E233E0|nr:hypothetical protein [Ruminococcus sp.]MBQ8965688.1 hypothetical protein [Ruminococcus sp.]